MRRHLFPAESLSSRCSSFVSARSRHQGSFPVTQMEEENQRVSAGWWLATTNLLSLVARFYEKMPECVCYQEQQFLPSTQVLRKEVELILILLSQYNLFLCPNGSDNSLKIVDVSESFCEFALSTGIRVHMFAFPDISLFTSFLYYL